jgi:hypothetical protein
MIAPGAPPVRVFIFDLDETLILFNDLVTNKYASAHNKVILRATSAPGAFWKRRQA